jgi:TIGR03009 family protein
MILPSRLIAVGASCLLAASASAQQGVPQQPLTFDQAAPPAQATTVPALTAPPASAPQQQPGYGQPPQTLPVATAPNQRPAGAAAASPQPQGAAPPTAPFVLSDEESQYVAQTLQLWEAKSAEIKTFNADFERYEYDNVFGPSTQAMIWSSGVLSYSKPDKGSFKIDTIRRWTKKDPDNRAPDAPGEFVEQKEEIGERWVCNGKAIYKYEDRLKQLQVTAIPPEMRGTAIADGPLPFLFGAKAQELMDRYWIRPKPHATQIWLEAFPKRQSDAANYDSVEVMLDPKTMHPQAIQVHLPGGQQRHAYVFQPPTINGKIEAWFGSLFNTPRTPLGWDLVELNEQGLPAGPQAAAPTDGVQR